MLRCYCQVGGVFVRFVEFEVGYHEKSFCGVSLILDVVEHLCGLWRLVCGIGIGIKSSIRLSWVVRITKAVVVSIGAIVECSSHWSSILMSWKVAPGWCWILLLRGIASVLILFGIHQLLYAVCYSYCNFN